MSPESRSGANIPTGRDTLVDPARSRTELSVLHYLSDLSLKGSGLMQDLSTHDPRTYRHALRVASISVRTGQNLLVSIHEMSLLNLSVIHDIGKLYVPKLLLRGKPTPSGVQKIRYLHMRGGRDLIKGLSDLNATLRQEVLQFIMLHHELIPNINGLTADTGPYPRKTPVSTVLPDGVLFERRVNPLLPETLDAAWILAMADKADRLLTDDTGDPRPFSARFRDYLVPVLPEERRPMIAPMIAACMSLYPAA